ncbi:MAG: hypothetical protein ABEJ28_11295, partial [Salinigranum sp.]
MVSVDESRLLGVLLALVGGSLSVFHLLHALSEPLNAALIVVGVAVPAGLSLLLVGAGYELATSEASPRNTVVVSGWTLAGILATTALALVGIAYQHFHGVELADQSYLIVNYVTGGAV